MQMQQRTAVVDALGLAVCTHLAPCLEGLIDASNEAFKEQRLAARSNVEAQSCEDFLRLCSVQRICIIDETIEAIRGLLSSGIAPPAVAPSHGSEWQLVDDAEVDEMLEARRLVRQLREPLGVMEWRSCARLNALTGAAAKDRENPLSLEFMLRALQSQLQLRAQPPMVRELFYAVAARELGHALQTYFKHLDTLFSTFQIEPRIDPIVQPAQERQRERAARHPDGPYQAIQQLRAAGLSAAGLNGFAEVAATPVQDAGMLQQALAQLQGLKPPPEGWSSQAVLQCLSAAGAVLTPRQRDDVGVVSELFQHMEQEHIIASGIKPALRRLMVPVAQAALFDPAAFADASHPVRATLDKLIGLCDFSEPPNHALENRVQQLIDGIVEDYQGDSSVFSQCSQELEHLLSVQQRAYRNNADRVRQYNRGRDALEYARKQIDRELARLFGSHAPKVLLAWLDAGWHELLVHELLRYGQESVELLAGLAVIHQLNGWLQAKSDGEPCAIDPIERAYECGPLLELLRKRMDTFLPGQYRHTPVLKQLQQQLLGEQAVELVAVAVLPPDVRVPSVEPAQLRWRERVQQLSEGNWLLTQDGQYLQLVWANAASDHYVLVDRQGHEAGSFTAHELMQQLAAGWIGTSAPDGQGVIQDHLEDIVGKLYRDIAYARSHDELTGLLNRRSFEAAAAQALATTEACPFIYGHIDQFSVLNSSFGPLAGDTYLKQTASLLADLLPANATLARIGGVDFAVILPQTAIAQASRFAEQARAAIEAAPLEWQGHSQSVTMSLGIVLTNERHDVITLFRDLQVACNTAKESGRNRVHISVDELDGARTGLLAIAGRVDDIVERGELSLRVQQIAPAAVTDKQLPHYEVLLVMENDLNLLDFISAAERYNRMTKVDRWVLKRIFSELAQHPHLWTQCSGLSINLSGSSLNDDKLLEFIEALFEDYPVPADKICFELTETAAVANLAKTADLVRYLQRLGCTFSIDDFGTGFSSYEYLKRLPVDYVKIDGSFVKEIECSPSDLAMVKSINEIAHVLGRKTIAEYVETVSIRERLAELGIDYVQGYGVQLPLTFDELLSGCYRPA
ncbi:DUF1631 family protein [Pseudomonas sp.]|uniref:DUF1631 family protein n=1 Tax=Pseudomonas sp. TaxID=306 RepID=UPI003C71487C